LEETKRAIEEEQFRKHFKKSDIFLRPFIKNTLGFTFLMNVIHEFESKPISDLRSTIEDIIAHNMKAMLIKDLKDAYVMAKSLTDKELVKFVALVNPLFKNKHSWGIRQAILKKRLKEYDGRKKINRKRK
jgi:hypothetical protein